jgi:carboxyl-terminal processing protease
MNALSLALLVLGLPQAAPAPDLNEAWDAVSKAITSRYYGRGQDRERMERLLSEAAPSARAAKTVPEFAGVVNRMIRQFGDSHFDFFTQDDQGYYLMESLVRRDATPMPHVGAWFRRAETEGDGYTVQMLLDGGPAAAAGLRKGDVVLSKADGTPFAPVASLRGREKVRLLVRRPNGTRNEVEVEVREQPALGAFLDATRASTRIIERGGKRIGYFRLWTMANDEFRNALTGAVSGRLRDTDAMIVDLRDGFGGRPEGFFDPFFRPDVELEWITGGISMRQQFGYGRPLVVLINEGSRSAKEVAAYILKKSGRATLIGSRTAGHVLGTAPLRLNDWSYLEIPMVELRVDGTTLEGAGVTPHVEVKREFDTDGKDIVLELGIQRILTSR